MKVVLIVFLCIIGWLTMGIITFFITALCVRLGDSLFSEPDGIAFCVAILLWFVILPFMLLVLIYVILHKKIKSGVDVVASAIEEKGNEN